MLKKFVLRMATALAAVSMIVGAGLTPVQAATKTVTLIDSFDIIDWDPAVIYSAEVRTMLNVYETLTHYNAETGEAEPLLATDWSVSDDGLTWTFNLRTGVSFHDGSAFNAAAAKASLDRTIEINGGAAYIWSSVETISAPAEHTLVITTKYPMPLDLVGTSQYGAYMLSPEAAAKGKDWLYEGNASGTGPYYVRQWDKGQQLVMEKFDDYWGGWSDDQFDRIIVRFVAEISTQVQMLRTGEADLMLSTAPADTLIKLKEEPGMTVSVFNSWLNIPLMINTQMYPTDNKKFRQALTHLMDYEAIARDIYGGYGTVPKSCVPQSMWGSGNYDMPTLDFAKAKQLLEESGVPKSDWKVKYMAYTGRQEIGQIAELFQALAAQVGVEVEIQQGEWGVLWDKQKHLETAGNMFGVMWWADWPTPSGWLEPMWHTEDPILFNFGHYSNPEFDKLLDDAIELQGADRATSIAKFEQAQGIVIRDAVAMCLVDLKKTLLHRSDLTGVYYNSAYETVSVYNLRRSQ